MIIFENGQYQEQLQYVSSFLPKDRQRFLITGASGLIGSCLVDSLMFANIFQDGKYEVFALGRSEEKLKHRFSYANRENGLQLVQGNICDKLKLNNSFDFIIHAASNADPRSYALYPTETLLTNVLGTKSVLDYVKMHKECRVMLTSTFEVYGNAGEKGVLTEDSVGAIDFHILRNCYPASKVCAELLCQGYGEQYDVDYVVGRLCGIYGPTMSQNDSKAQAQFIINAQKGVDIVMKSKGEQMRSYCYVIDAVIALLTILLKGKSKEAYNVADEKSIVTIADFARIAAGMGSVGVKFDLPDEIESKGYSKPIDIKMDNAKLKELGWNAKYSLEEGIKTTVSILKTLYRR